MASNVLKKIFQPGRRGKVWWAFVFIILLSLGAALIDAGSYYNRGADWVSEKTGVNLPHTKIVDFRLGLDLQGGTHLVYEADMNSVDGKDRDSALEGVRDVIERRVNVFGVSEPNLQTTSSGNDYRLVVELAGVKDVNEAIKMIGETPLLEFKEQIDLARDLTNEEVKQLEEFNKKQEEAAVEVLGKVLSNGDFAALAKEYSQDFQTADKGGDMGWITGNEYSQIVDAVKDLSNNTVNSELVELSESYEILKLEEKRVKTSVLTNEPEKEVKASHILICYDGASRCESGLSKDDAYNKIKELKDKATPSNFDQLAKENSTEANAATSGGSLGWFGVGTMVKPFEDAVIALEKGKISDIVETDFGYHLIYKVDEKTVNEYKVSRISFVRKNKTDITGAGDQWKNTELTGKYLSRATVQFDPNDNTPQVALQFNSEGSDLFTQITERNIGKPVAIFLDGYPISTPTVNERISGGSAVISGNFNIQEAKLLAQRLNAGALPVPISLVSQQTVGASLGNQSVQDSLRAALIGLLLVALFMIAYYRLPGVLAVLSLIIYGTLILALFKLWPVTLTLAGIAGFILSIGMAVDANVLIFERIKEELSKGRPIGMAIDEGFKRAWTSIRDGNVSTLITCFILVQFSTSVVQGFAITLALGVVISMFSAIVITKNFLNLIGGNWLESRLWLIGKKR